MSNLNTFAFERQNSLVITKIIRQNYISFCHLRKYKNSFKNHNYYVFNTKPGMLVKGLEVLL